MSMQSSFNPHVYYLHELIFGHSELKLARNQTRPVTAHEDQPLTRSALRAELFYETSKRARRSMCTTTWMFSAYMLGLEMRRVQAVCTAPMFCDPHVQFIEVVFKVLLFHLGGLLAGSVIGVLHFLWALLWINQTTVHLTANGVITV